MPFPDSPRVIYRRSPLVEVVCQLRFPTILRIDTAPPVEFQDAIRDQYPEFIEAREQMFAFQVGKGVPVMNPPAAVLNYTFQSANAKWRVNLTRDFLALTSLSYGKWEDFCARLNPVIAEFERIYRPAYYGRIGLRYRDLVRRSALILPATEPWGNLLAPQIAGELADDRVASTVLEVQKHLVVELSDIGGRVAVRHGLVVEDNEQCYVVDADFFTMTRTEVQDGRPRLDSFNRYARRLWRWAISDRLHAAMEPDAQP